MAEGMPQSSVEASHHHPHQRPGDCRPPISARLAVWGGRQSPGRCTTKARARL